MTAPLRCKDAKSGGRETKTKKEPASNPSVQARGTPIPTANGKTPRCPLATAVWAATSWALSPWNATRSTRRRSGAAVPTRRKDRQTIGIRTKSRHTCCPKFAKPSPVETGTRLPHSHSQTSTAKCLMNPGENRSSALALSPLSANSASPRDTMKTPFLTIDANFPSIQPLPPWHTKRLMA